MNRNIVFVLSITLLAFSANAPLAQHVVDKEATLQGYLNNVQRANALQARVQLQFQRFLKNSITDDLKPELERIYSLPIEDQVYEQFPLFFNSVMLMNWDTVLDGLKMTGNQTVHTSYMELRAVDPRFDMSAEFIRRLQSSSEMPLEYRFTLEPANSTIQSNMFHLFIPDDIVEFFYLPNYWYPSPQFLGFPDDIEQVETRSSTLDPFVVFLFTPENLSPKLLRFLRGAILRPDITEKDVYVMLSIDSNYSACKKVEIGVKRIDPKHKWDVDKIIIIDHQVSATTSTGLPYPGTSNMWVNTFVQNGSETISKNLFFSELSVQSIQTY
ncbi:MAG: hypothetical protein P9L94_02555 [Candidatus Hinthialibacter antarcticus]|nr:hypothetical protein [Candidatus Hinthialibacter antarcticus]